jgi:hypothetical protein
MSTSRCGFQRGSRRALKPRPAAVKNTDSDTSSERTQRKFLRGAITDAVFRGGDGEKFEDVFPPDAFVGERVTSFLAASSWFWYCYPCFAQKAPGEGQRSFPVQQ